nr:methyltransferase domain-containing protein [Candidatus Aenigmarchaeota archaeon]NIP41078.1 methyltransferase domain-containing protein [Candidatus Aenigmarchaeota archaeon]NIQ17569.1 methyltransferase domain-containing protein [Candidatus Aenigmarchaeota archaeon]
MKRKRSSVLNDPVVEKITKKRRRYRVVDIFLAYERIYDLGILLRKRLNNYFERAVFEALDTGRRKGRILDLGTPFGMCGTAIAKQNQNFDITSFQESKKVVEVSKKFAREDIVRIDWRIGKPEELPFGNGSFDLVVSAFDLHKWEDPVKVLSEIDRVLKPRGEVVLLDVRSDRWWFFYLPALIYTWFVGGLWLFRKAKFAFKSSYNPW